EAYAADFYSALDLALDKLENRLRRVHDRRRVHHGAPSPVSVALATGALDRSGPTHPFGAATATLEASDGDDPYAEPLDDHLPGRIVGEKKHPAKPMTIDQALFEMELVGHDFYLFQDADSGRPSVVYRRKGYDYGVIRLTS